MLLNNFAEIFKLLHISFFSGILVNSVVAMFKKLLNFTFLFCNHFLGLLFSS